MEGVGMIQEIQNWIWNIGGALFVIALFLFLITLIISWCTNRLTMWTNKEKRKFVLYFIRNREKIIKIIEKENLRNKI